MRKLFTILAAALMYVGAYADTPVDYPYPIRHAGEVNYPYLKVGDRIAEGAEIKGDVELKVIFKTARHKSSGNLAAADNEVKIGDLNIIGVNGLVSGGFGQITPVNAVGEAGIEWEVASTGPLGTGPLELVGVGYPYELNYVDTVKCLDVKAGDSISAGAVFTGVGYIRFIGGTYKKNGVLQTEDSEVMEIKDYPYVGYPYCSNVGKIVIGENEFTSCDPAGNNLSQWLCYETGPLSTGPLGTGPLGTGPLALKGTGPLAPAPSATYTLLLVADPEKGSVAVTNLLGSDIIDNGNGNYTVPENAEVKILATPNEGFEFTGWKEGNVSCDFLDCGTALNTLDNQITFTMTADVAYLAEFKAAATTHTLRLVADPEKGSVAVTNLLGSDIIDNGDGTYTVPENAEVTILATPNEGYQFTGWKVGNSWCDFLDCGTALNTLDNPLTFTMTADVAYMAEFKAAATTHTLRLVADPEKGSVAVTNLLGSDIIDNGDGTYTVPENAEVTILATPNEGFEFTGWKVGNSWCDFTECGTALNTTDNPMTITMTEDVAYMAEFAEAQGIENIVLTEKAKKVVVDGVIYIVRDGKLFNLQGAQVK